MKTPRVTIGTLEGGVGSTDPSLRNLPTRGPTTSAPASAAQPPVPCTMVDPAKSLKSSAASQPPPQVQAPTIGYTTAVRIRVKRKNDQSLTRSARAPDTMDAAVATNTIWKNQLDMTE